MRRNTILTLVACMVIGLVALSLWRAGATTTITAGYDQFSTPANAVTHEDLSLGAGTFVNAAGRTSNSFNGTVTFQGGDLVSVGTIHVTFTDGSAADYSVSVKESPSQVSNGTMHFNADGTFSNSLQINRQYTFSSPGQPTQVIDSAAAGWPAISLTSTGTWSMTGGMSAPGSGPSAMAATSTSGGVTIVPNTHQSIIAQHATTRPSPSPSPTRTIHPIQVAPADQQQTQTR
jgi:hypothetical protein